MIKEKQQLTNFMTYGMGQVFSLVSPLIVLPYVTKICGEGGLGKTGVGMAISFFLIVIIDYGNDITGVKNVAVNRDERSRVENILSTVYSSKLILLCMVLAVMSVLYCTIPYFSKEKELFLLGLPILVGQFINPTWVLQGIENFKEITALTITSKVIFVIGVLLTVKSPGDYIYVNLWWGIGMIFANLVAFIRLQTKYKITFGNTSKTDVSGFLKGNFSMFFSQIFLSLQLYSPIVLISFFAGDIMAGKYKIIEQIISVFKTYIFLFFSYVYPKVCYLLEKNVKEGLRFWKLYNGVNFVLIALGMLLLYLLAIPIVTFFGSISPKESAGYLHLAIFIPLALGISIPLKQLVLGWDYQKFYIRLTIVMVTFNVVLLFILLKFYLIYGVLGSLIITEIITALLYIVPIKKRLFGHN